MYTKEAEIVWECGMRADNTTILYIVHVILGECYIMYTR